jgi:hypothetical protein
MRRRRKSTTAFSEEVSAKKDAISDHVYTSWCVFDFSYRYNANRRKKLYWGYTPPEIHVTDSVSIGWTANNNDERSAIFSSEYFLTNTYNINVVPI